MKGFVVFMMAWVVFYAFEQTFRWDVIEILAAMAALLFIPPFILDRLMSKTAQAYCDAHENWVWVLFVGVTVLTFIVYQIGDTPFHHRIDEEITIFIGLWWCCWPYGCACLLIADRSYNLFDKLSSPASPPPTKTLWERLDVYEAAEAREAEEELADNVFLFDPDLFKKDKLH